MLYYCTICSPLIVSLYSNQYCFSSENLLQTGLRVNGSHFLLEGIPMIMPPKIKNFFKSFENQIHSFLVYNSTIFSKFTELCNHHQNLTLEHFYHSKKIPHIHLQPQDLSPSPLLIHSQPGRKRIP